MGAFAKAQAEGKQGFDALVKEGATLQKKTQSVAEEKFGDVTSKMTSMADDVSASAGKQWDKLESIFEERTAKAMKKLGVPSSKDVDALMDRIDALSAQVARRAKSTARTARRRPSSGAKKAVERQCARRARARPRKAPPGASKEDAAASLLRGRVGAGTGPENSSNRSNREPGVARAERRIAPLYCCLVFQQPPHLLHAHRPHHAGEPAVCRADGGCHRPALSPALQAPRRRLRGERDGDVAQGPVGEPEDEPACRSRRRGRADRGADRRHRRRDDGRGGGLQRRARRADHRHQHGLPGQEGVQPVGRLGADEGRVAGAARSSRRSSPRARRTACR